MQTKSPEQAAWGSASSAALSPSHPARGDVILVGGEATSETPLHPDRRVPRPIGYSAFGFGCAILANASLKLKLSKVGLLSL